MKIVLEHNQSDEIEVIVKGNNASDEYHNIVNLLNNADFRKTSRMIIGKLYDKEFVLPVSQIEAFFTDQNNLYAKYQNIDHKIGAKLFEVEQLYSSYGFRRISKGVLLNCAFINYLEVEFSGNYTAVTKTSNIFHFFNLYYSLHYYLLCDILI